MQKVLKEIEKNVRVIPSTRKYWFIRTYSGRLFDEFTNENYIGIGLNNVPYRYIKDANKNDSTYKTLHSYLLESLQYQQSEATRWANQLINFEHNVNVDDIVIIPSESSSELAIGVITSDTYIVDVNNTFKFNDTYEPFPQKRKKIEWLKKIYRHEFLGDIRSMFSSHQAISNIDRFGDMIEGNITSLFIKDNHSFFNIKINQDEEINAFELNRFLSSITYFYKEICQEIGIEDNEDLTIKIKVQSKGGVALKALAYSGIFGLAGIFALSKDPKIKLNIGKYVNFEASSGGLGPALTDFLNKKAERQIKLEELNKANSALEATTVDGEDEDANEEEDLPFLKENLNVDSIKIDSVDKKGLKSTKNLKE